MILMVCRLFISKVIHFMHNSTTDNVTTQPCHAVLLISAVQY